MRNIMRDLAAIPAESSSNLSHRMISLRDSMIRCL